MRHPRMVRRYFAAGIWLALTVTATVIVWAAVSVVAADVTDRPAPVVGHRDVVVALQAGANKPPTSTTVVLAPVPTTVPRAATTAPPTSRPPGGSRAPTVTTVAPPPAPPAAPTTTVKNPVRPPAPTTTTTLAPVGGTATYSTNGGVVAVACTGFNTIRLVAALPNDGFQALVLSSGPFFVQMNFIGPGTNIPVGAACVFGQPFQYSKGQTPAASGPPTTTAGG